MSSLRVLAFTVVLAAALPAAARADVFLVPFAGINFGGDSGKEFGDAVDAENITWGVSLGYMGSGIFGVEADFGYSPEFFGTSDLGDSRVVTLMGNLLLGVPLGGQSGFGVRPYALVGIGLIRTDADTFATLEVGENEVGWNVGGGVMLFFGPVGVRGDVRYIRTFSALDLANLDELEPAGNLDFTRGSLGFIIRF
jgi:Outer membrane protein beta-barrel domain